MSVALRIFALIAALAILACCSRPEPHQETRKARSNPVVYFEIPATDLDRAMRFYGAVFGFTFQRESIDGNDMALFPLAAEAAGASGALAKGSTYVPSKTGSLVYFRTEDLAKTLERVKAAGGKVLYPVTATGANGYVAEFEDSEGNRVALHSTGQ